MMSFNKRYIDEEVIRTILREDGFKTLIDFVRSPDALIINDNFSQKVCDIIKENNDDDTTVFEKLLELNII
jgi:hypothetical protein